MQKYSSCERSDLARGYVEYPEEFCSVPSLLHYVTVVTIAVYEFAAVYMIPLAWE